MSSHCQDALDRLFEYIDQELPEDQIKEIAAHLKACPPCEAEARVAERIKQMVAGCPQEQAPEHLKARILAVIAEARAAD